MPKFGVVPPEVPVQRSLDLLAPKFRDAVLKTLARVAGGRPEWPFETLRTLERQEYLFGFGRAYDDGRGKVTKATTALSSWHGFGLAVDVVEKDGSPWDAPPSFWLDLGTAAELEGLTWGGRWGTPDLPHIQWGKCPASPTPSDKDLIIASGMHAVWSKYGADV
jgi:peptidoglycan L-alanyl-D-glutamate endopeptidase CwlK